MNSIYANADPALLKLFECAGHLRKVLCAPLDFAKKTHTTLFCNGVGDVLKKPFIVANSPEGVEKLLSELSATCKHRGIEPKHAFFGGEDTPSYAENFTSLLRRKGYLVARVNALDAKNQRENLQASTDQLDLQGIAHCLLKGRARVLGQKPDLHQQLRLLVREREFFVRLLTAVDNHLHPHVDRLFPGFLNSKQSGIEPHTKACWWLLEDRFSAPQIARRDLDKLTEGLRKYRIVKPEEVAAQLQALAAEALSPSKEWIAPSQAALEKLVGVARCLKETINGLEPQIAALLLQSPGARLTTIPGLGVTLSAGITAELCLLPKLSPLDKICSYAGSSPATEQSGGPQKAARSKPTRSHCNYRLKYYLLRAGERMGQLAGTDAYDLRQRCEQKGQHTLRVLGKHVAAVARALLAQERAYLPARLYHCATTAKDARGHYYMEYWPKLLKKWSGLASFGQVFDPAQPMGAWRIMAQDAYQILLPLPGSHSTQENQPKEQSNTTTDGPEIKDSELI